MIRNELVGKLVEKASNLCSVFEDFNESTKKGTAALLELYEVLGAIKANCKHLEVEWNEEADRCTICGITQEELDAKHSPSE